MADIEHIPTPPTLLEGPYVEIDYPLEPNDNVRIVAGDWRGIPQHWALEKCYIPVTTSAVVANRSVWVEQYKDLTELIKQQAIRSNAIAASISSGLAVNSFCYDYKTVFEAVSIAGTARDWVFKGDNLLRFYLASNQVGDVWSISLVLKYLNRALGIPTPYDYPAEEGGG